VRVRPPWPPAPGEGSSSTISSLATTFGRMDPSASEMNVRLIKIDSPIRNRRGNIIRGKKSISRMIRGKFARP
jgi:hypothetical protein